MGYFSIITFWNADLLKGNILLDSKDLETCKFYTEMLPGPAGEWRTRGILNRIGKT